MENDHILKAHFVWREKNQFLKITIDSNFHSLFLQERDIRNASLSKFGVAQAVIEIILMLYPLLCDNLKLHKLQSSVWSQIVCV